MPQLACLWTTSLTASRTRASKATRSICSPRSCASNMCCKSSGLGKLPVCVVRILFVLFFMGVFLLHEANDLTVCPLMVIYLLLYAIWSLFPLCSLLGLSVLKFAY